MQCLLDHSILLQYSGAILALLLFLDRYAKHSSRPWRCVVIVMVGYAIVTVLRQRIPRLGAPLHYSPLWYGAVEVVLLYAFGLTLNDTVYRMGALALLLYFVAGHFWCTYLQGMNEYLLQQSDLTEVPRNRMLMLNTKIILLILGAFAIVCVGVCFVPLDLWFDWIRRYLGAWIALLLRMIRRLLSFFERNGGNTPTAMTTTYDIAETTDATALGEGAEISTPVFLFLMVSTIAFFYLLWRLSSAYFEKKDPPWQRPDFSGVNMEHDVMEDVVSEEKKGFLHFRNNREKVRYRFKRRIKKSMKGSIPARDTARELASQIETKEQVSLETLTEIYEKARYSDRAITKEDVAKTRQKG
jgi:hypothetical protein